MKHTQYKYKYKICAFPNPFKEFFARSWWIVRLQLINLTMKNDDMKQERRRKRMHCSIKCYLYKPDTQQKYFKSNSEPKKPKSIAGFKSGLLRHDAVILLNIPPPPRHIYKTFKSMNNHKSKNKPSKLSLGFSFEPGPSGSVRTSST